MNFQFSALTGITTIAWSGSYSTGFNFFDKFDGVEKYCITEKAGRVNERLTYFTDYKQALQYFTSLKR